MYKMERLTTVASNASKSKFKKMYRRGPLDSICPIAKLQYLILSREKKLRFRCHHKRDTSFARVRSSQ